MWNFMFYNNQSGFDKFESCFKTVKIYLKWNKLTISARVEDTDSKVLENSYNVLNLKNI